MTFPATSAGSAEGDETDATVVVLHVLHRLPAAAQRRLLIAAAGEVGLTVVPEGDATECEPSLALAAGASR